MNLLTCGVADWQYPLPLPVGQKLLTSEHVDAANEPIRNGPEMMRY